jgi:hypothetical protein
MIDLELLHGIADDVREVLMEERQHTEAIIKGLRDELEAVKRSIPENLWEPEPIVGPPGKDGEPGKPGERGPEGKDGRDGRDAVDGRDGRDGKDGIATRDELNALVQSEVEKRLMDLVEKRVNEVISSIPIVTYKGVYSDGNEYAAGNTATYGGSLWHANVTTKEKPGTGSDWTLAVKKGRDGRDAK